MEVDFFFSLHLKCGRRRGKGLTFLLNLFVKFFQKYGVVPRFCQKYGSLLSFSKNMELYQVFAKNMEICQVLPKMWKFRKSNYY